MILHRERGVCRAERERVSERERERGGIQREREREGERVRESE